MRPKRVNRHSLPAATVSTLVLLALASVPMAGEPPAGPQRVWPLEIPIQLSSSFGEFRSGHLHAGLDIRTFGREGVPCRAVDDGWISRLRSSPFGYGKAVYLTLHSGETVVYAHLSERSAVLDSVVYEAQTKAGGYRVDLYFDPDELPVRRGEILGFTGRTGAAAQHLHFEVRDEDQNPLNPLSIGWELEDGEPPRIRQVGWLPLSSSTRIDGACVPVIQDLQERDPDTYVAADTVRLVGRVGLSARVVDRLGPSSGRLAPYRVELLVDGRLLSSIELEHFTYDHTGEVELAYDMLWARAGAGHFLFLFRREGETLWNRSFVRGGLIETDSLPSTAGAEPRVHTALVRAIDRGGNVAVATLPFTVASGDERRHRRQGPVTGSSPAGRSDRELVGCYFLGDVMNIRGSVVAWGPVPLAPGTGADSGWDADRGEGDWTLSVGQTDRAWSLGHKEDGRVRQVNILPVDHTTVVTGAFPDVMGGVASLSTREGSLYADAFLYLTTWEDGIGPGGELRPVTGALRVGPLSLACKSSMEITVRLEHGSEGREAFYRLQDREDEWKFVSSFVRMDTVSAYIDVPGVYSVCVDTLAPSVGPPRVGFRKSYATGKKSPELSVPVKDEGCGVDYERTEIYVDGNKQIARWDGFSEKMFVLFGNQNIIGVHDLSVTAVDRVGNTSRVNTKFHIPTPKTGGSGGETKHNAP